MHPSNDNIAARSLSKMRQTRNVRKVKVNAQVTFVIYILETVANLSIFVVWFFVNHGNNNLTLTLSVLWFNVILPYTFLMNTSHNKNLVADDGWWNTNEDRKRSLMPYLTANLKQHIALCIQSCSLDSVHSKIMTRVISIQCLRK